MKISTSWLSEFVSLPGSAETLAARFTMAGLEVAQVYPAVPRQKSVRVGRVLTLEPHPHADKLKVCSVDAGDERLQIICGAPNVHIDMKAPVALAGATLADGRTIRNATLRGIDSMGMLCSARELGLSDDQSGLFELDEDAEVGAPLATYLGGADTIIEIEITPNRGDCLSMLGVAREAGVLLAQEVRLPRIPATEATIADTLAVAIEAPEACPTFTGRIVRGIDPHAHTPLWLRERLRRAGVRPVNPVVDVTQYVMVELGQPLHGYDLSALNGGIIVRYARPEEHITLLNADAVALEPEMLIITDHTRPISLAGIMGGADSAVQSDTVDVFLECAYFNPAAVNGRARALGLTSDAGYRFERGVDPTGQARALERASQLLLEIAGGAPGPLIAASSEAHQPRRDEIILRRERLNRLLGIDVPDADVEHILEHLGMTFIRVKRGWRVTAPPHRFDIEIEEDLIEEVGRIHGYDRIPAIQYPHAATMQPRPEARVPLQRLREALIGRGYQEVITYSFVDTRRQETLLGQPGIALANPVSAEMAAMRMSLLPGLIDTLSFNLHRQQSRVRIFETGLRFIRQANEIKQENVIAGLVSGALYPEQWDSPERAADFYDLKGDVEALLALGNHSGEFETVTARHPALHPGQAAQMRLAGQDIGWLGRLHPNVVRELDLKQDALVFELALDPLLNKQLPQLNAISRFPAIRRDLAIVVTEDVSSAELLACARQAAPPIVQSLFIFDAYQGAGVERGSKSIALGLILQEFSRTLTDEDVNRAVNEVQAGLQERLGATIRE